MYSSTIRRRNRKFLGLLIGGNLFFFGSVFLFIQMYGKPAEALGENPAFFLQINEVCATNPGTLSGSAVTYEDYIELYNPTDKPISLENLYLSDKRGQLDLGALPGDTIQPGSYYLLYAVGDDGSAPEGCASLPFRLSAGETIFLSFASPQENSQVKPVIIDSLLIPDLSAGAVFGCLLEEPESFAALRPSPGLSNTADTVILESPSFSAESGFYEGSLTLSILAPEDLPVYYTLDGSEPTRDSLRYQSPLILTDPSASENVYAAREDISAKSSGYAIPDQPVDKAVIVRAAVILEDGSRSDPITGVYFLDFQEKEGYEDVPIISLVTDPNNLFSSEQGIYVRGDLYEDGLEAGEINEYLSWIELMDYTNYYLEGMQSERTVRLDVFDENHLPLTGQDCGVRIRGNESRSFPQKSFSLFARSRYGADAFEPVFWGTDISYPDLILNNGSKLKKVFFSNLVSDRAAATQAYTPCQVFLNGEYWGMYYLMEKYSSEYLEGHYGVTAADTLLIKATWEVQDGDPADISLLKELRSYLEQDMSDPELYGNLLTQMDMQSFIDWMCTNIYICNTDSKPLGGNVFTWQTIHSSDLKYCDGKWRWMLYDLDDSLAVGMDTSVTPAYAVDSFVDHAGYAECGFLDDAPMPSLMGNEDFREQFVLTFLDMANENFKASRVLALLDEIEEKYSPWADKGYERWNTNPLDTPFSEQVSELRSFFENRFDYIVPCLAEHFSLEGELVTLTLSARQPEGGTVTLNTISPDLTEGSWTGKYYTDYPVTLTAQAARGYTFLGWELEGGSLLRGDASQTEISVLLGDEGTNVKAMFGKE